MGSSERTIINNLNKVRSCLKGAQLLAVTKYVGIREIRVLQEAGQASFGENRIDPQTIQKTESIRAKWHFIGHLQSNKVKEAVEHFDWIDSIDSEKIAQKVSEEALIQGKIIQVLIQVNIGDEPQKFGIKPDEIDDILKRTMALKGINIRGLMCITPRLQPEERRPYFKKMKKIFDEKRFDTLSMGMSDDYHIAIEEGATIVRVGSRLYDGTDLQ